jgi:uncharacterized protein (DUF1778 family)
MQIHPVERTFLTAEEAERLIQILNNPPEPGPSMIEAARRYKRRFKDETETSKDS